MLFHFVQEYLTSMKHGNCFRYMHLVYMSQFCISQISAFISLFIGVTFTPQGVPKYTCNDSLKFIVRIAAVADIFMMNVLLFYRNIATILYHS